MSIFLPSKELGVFVFKIYYFTSKLEALLKQIISPEDVVVRFDSLALYPSQLHEAVGLLTLSAEQVKHV